MGATVHKVAHDTLKVKRWLRTAADRLERMPQDLYVPLGVDAGTWSRWESLNDERFIHLGMLPTVIQALSEEEMENLFDLIRNLSGHGQEKTPKERPIGA